MGINTISKTILGSLFRKPATAMYPVIINEFYENTRGHITYDSITCNHCTLCAKKCPAGAITVDRTARTWTLDCSLCIMCLNCVFTCNKNSLAVERGYSPPALSKDQYIKLYEAPRKSAADEEEQPNA